ncbi:MAG: methyltransferase domain-containing protein [Deltaproteobacteria bacterium]|nr:MAG: methyltransferase domain-containing protein [Deltaproteobacteria bacterium]
MPSTTDAGRRTDAPHLDPRAGHRYNPCIPERNPVSAQLRRHSSNDPRLIFFQAFLKRPREVASIVPSSRFLMRRAVRTAHLESARVVVELGPGTGGTTRALLRGMADEARLVAIEINPRLVRTIEATIRDPRLTVHHGSAADIAPILEHHDLGAADVILSGIPFSTMDRATGIAILQAAHDALAPGGRFVAYQMRDRVEQLARRVFGPGTVQTELRNVPPMRVYCWRKPVLDL